MSYFYYILPAVIAIAAVRKFREYQWGFCRNNVSLQGKVVLITGANSGIGYEIAKELASRGAKVIVACRNLEKANKVVLDILSELPQSKVSSSILIPAEVDLASLKSVVSLVKGLEETEGKIDILINNAGVAYPKEIVKNTVDGFEIHFGVNHLSHFLLTNLLLDKLKAAAPSRVIIVSSSLHQKGTIYLDDLNLLDRRDKTNQYSNSKLANAYFCRELAKRVKNDGINSYAVCPGWVNTSLFRNYRVKWFHYVLLFPVIFFFMRTRKQGAQTVIYCATEPGLENETGLFYRDCQQYKSSVEFDDEIAEKLWDASRRMIDTVL